MPWKRWHDASRRLALAAPGSLAALPDTQVVLDEHMLKFHKMIGGCSTASCGAARLAQAGVAAYQTRL